MLWLWLGIALAAPLDSLITDVTTAPSWGEGAALVQSEYKRTTDDAEARAQLFSLLQVTSALDNWSIPPHPSVGRAYLEAAISSDEARRTLALQHALAETPMPTSSEAEQLRATEPIAVKQPVPSKAAPAAPLGPPPPPPAAVRAYLDGYLTREPVQSLYFTNGFAFSNTTMEVFEGGSALMGTRDLAAAFNDKEAMKNVDYALKVDLPASLILITGGIGLMGFGVFQEFENGDRTSPWENGNAAMIAGLVATTLSLVPLTRFLVRMRPQHHWTDRELNAHIRTYNDRLAEQHGLSEQQALDAEQGR